MNRKLKAQRMILLLLTLLCGLCAGMLLPCQACRTRDDAAAFSRAGGDVAAWAQSGGADLPEASVGATAAPQAGSPAPTAASTPAAPAATALPGQGTPSPSPLSTPENLFTIDLAPTQTPVSAARETPTASDALAPGTGFGIEVIGTNHAARRKRILIYHTHTYEAYEQSADQAYRETEQWRTPDESYNVVRVGEELAGLLSGLGMEVMHDTTAFEPPNLSTAYARSLEMLERRKGAGETYDLYIDLHRDAFTSSQTAVNTVNVGGADAARLMLLIGKGEGQTTEGFDQRPDWEANLKIAQAMTTALNDQVDGLCKDVRLKSGRFNQHIAVGCMLVEVGNNRNTLDQALAAMPYLADAIADALP